jgi:hypothetical protein
MSISRYTELRNKLSFRQEDIEKDSEEDSEDDSDLSEEIYE